MNYLNSFLPAKASNWMLWLFQQWIRIDLWIHNRLCIEKSDLERFKNLGPDTGIILTPNHADEADFKVCIELSRLTGRRFCFMMNSEAFNEWFGVAGWLLQRIGAFSVDRGGETGQAKRFAIDTLKDSKDVLVIFPEGEIYYLNDKLQSFKSGAVEVGIKSVMEMRSKNPQWEAVLVPMAIKYRYNEALGPLMDKKICRIEKQLSRRVRSFNLQMRLALILAELLHREEIAHRLEPGSASLAELSDRVQDVRQAVLQQLEAKYPAGNPKNKTPLMDRIWQLSHHVRSLLKDKHFSEWRQEILKDLDTLKRLAEMGSWQPDYVDVSASQERLAETIMKLERDVLRIKRPSPLATRRVYVRLGKAIKLSDFWQDYLEKPHVTRHLVSEQLKGTIQELLNSLDGASHHPDSMRFATLQADA